MGATALLALTIGMAGSARAAEPASLGVFNDWTAYTYKAADTNVCYVVSQPKSSEAAKKVKRDPIFFIVTHIILFLPYLNGERTPHDDPRARAAFHSVAPM